AQASRELRRLLGPGLSPDRFGQPRLCCPARLAATCWALQDATFAPLLYEHLAPYAGRHAVGPELRSHGAVDRYLGQLATLLGRLDDADAHFEAAHRLHQRMRTRPWDAFTKGDHARTLLARAGAGDRARAAALLSAAEAEFRALGMDLYAERASAVLSHAPNQALLREEGDGWVFGFGDGTVRVRDSKGVRYLAELLRHPAQELTAGQLVGDDDAERARHAATRAIKGAMDRLAEADRALGDHLRATVRVGSVSSYQPDPRAPIVWEG
ncbi:MAG: hypothetical protein LC792_18560, partial [Actinobacteria bacterium]|nr:hypothetical protein [Actinomycetota bacterium]